MREIEERPPTNGNHLSVYIARIEYLYLSEKAPDIQKEFLRRVASAKDNEASRKKAAEFRKKEMARLSERGIIPSPDEIKNEAIRLIEKGEPLID